MRPALDATYQTRSLNRLAAERQALMAWIGPWLLIAFGVYGIASALALIFCASVLGGEFVDVP